ncbi:MAG: hypothetical protein ACLVHF_10005, partial [Collinsella sp.]
RTCADECGKCSDEVDNQGLLHAKAFDQKTPKRLHKSRAIMQSNAVKPLAISPHRPERNYP